MTSEKCTRGRKRGEGGDGDKVKTHVLVPYRCASTTRPAPSATSAPSVITETRSRARPRTAGGALVRWKKARTTSVLRAGRMTRTRAVTCARNVPTDTPATIARCTVSTTRARPYSGATVSGDLGTSLVLLSPPQKGRNRVSIASYPIGGWSFSAFLSRPGDDDGQIYRLKYSRKLYCSSRTWRNNANRVISRVSYKGYMTRTNVRFLPNPKKIDLSYSPVSPQLRVLRTNERCRVSQRLRKRFPRVFFFLHANVTGRFDEYRRVSFSNRSVESFGTKSNSNVHTIHSLSRLTYSISKNAQNKRPTVSIVRYRISVCRKNDKTNLVNIEKTL